MTAQIIPIKMETSTHAKLKTITATCNSTQGKILELIVDSVMARMKNIQDANELPPYRFDALLFNMLILRDLGKFSQEEFDRQIAEFQREIKPDIRWSDIRKIDDEYFKIFKDGSREPLN